MANVHTTKSLRPAVFRLFVLSALFLVAGISPSWSQPIFSRTTFNDTYSSLSVGSGAIVSSATGDNANQSAIPLGFTFNYAGVDYTSIGLSTNGLLWFDAVEPAATTGNGALVTTTAPNQSLAPWCANLIDDASSDILYQLQGSPGSQSFTIQYTNYPTFTGIPGSNVRMNCQIVLHETSNVIEFRYGSLNVIGAQTTSGGAMIGIEWGAGGSQNFIEAVTGSSIVNHRMLSPLSGWPSYNFRFTPGAPAPIAAGTYNVGVGQEYNSLTQAVADANHRGLDGAVTFNLTDAQYDTTAANGSNIFPIFVATPNGSATNTLAIAKTGDPATLAYRGSNISASGAGWGTGVSTSAIGHGSEPLLGVCASYTTISNINLATISAPQTVEIGLAVFELFGNKGAQNNFFDKISVDLNRSHGNVYGIASFSTTSPGGFAGTNSNNTWRDLNIKDCNVGFSLSGVNNATGQADQNNQIITSSCDTYNYIGDPNTPDDIIGGGATGIGVNGQFNCTIRNCIIQNITGTSTIGDVDGIVIGNSFGTIEISNNIIRTLRRSNAALNSAHWVSGLRFIWDNQTMTFKIYNNSISNLLSSYTGAITNQAAVLGIFFQDTGAGTVTGELYNNSVSLNGSTFPNASSVCLAINSVSETFQIKNNVFANYTGPQSGLAYHACFYANAANSYGLSGSLADYNAYFLSDTANGYIGQATSTYYPTLAGWQTAMTLNPGTDANSLVANPHFTDSATDLHASNLSVALNGTGTTLPVYFTTDIDCETRTAPHDIGCDDFNFYTYFGDTDLDTYGDAGNTTETTSTTPPVGFVISNTDCDDTNAAINPGATEDFCNNIDDDCDGFTDEGAVDGCTNPLACNYNASATCDDGSCSAGILWYLDGDSDTYFSTTQNACTSPGAGWSNIAPIGGAGDCDDSNSGINPGASEIACNGIDEDCDSFIDEGSSSGCMNPLACNYNAAATCDNGSCTFEIMWYLDADNDTYYTSSQMACTSPGMGWVSTLPAGGTGDCNDNNASRNPGASEVCGNSADDDCDGLIDEGCIGGGGNNDSPGGATVVSFSGNAYPSCGAYNGNLTNATVSTEGNPSNVITGEDIWFSFYAASPAVRVVLNTTNFDGVLELHDAGNNELDVENMTGFGSSEIMNFVGLTENMQYFVAVRNYNSALGTGAFSICIQHLMDSNCDAGSGSYALCSNFKADYSGANQYIFHFTPSGGGATTSASSSSQVSLGLVSLGLQYGATYTNTIDAVYYLADGAGNPETIVVPGNEGCTVTIAAQPDVQVKATQRCPATILRGTTLQGKPFVCGAIQFRFEFTETDQFGTPIGVPFSRLTSGASPTMVLNFNSPQALVPGSFYSVRIKPIMSYGEGSYGTAHCIKIGGTSQLEWTQDEKLSEVESQMELSVYPNPNNGGMVHINLTDATAEIAIIDILDAQGRSIYTKQELISDSLNTTIQFDYALPSGLYMVKVRMGNDVLVERMHVVK